MVFVNGTGNFMFVCLVGWWGSQLALRPKVGKGDENDTKRGRSASFTGQEVALPAFFKGFGNFMVFGLVRSASSQLLLRRGGLRGDGNVLVFGCGGNEGVL